MLQGSRVEAARLCIGGGLGPLLAGCPARVQPLNEGTPYYYLYLLEWS